MKSSRIDAIDALRGVAILAMIAYHLSWDLSWFGHVDWQVSSAPEWRAFAAGIAGTFLFLAGVSLTLAHQHGVRWRAFWKREAVIVLAAAGVSLATSFTFGDAFVRFGILHAIATSSLIALPFLRAPAWLSLVGAALIASLPFWAKSHVFDGQLLLWSGLGTPDLGAVDYVPLAPWAGLTMLGVGLTRALTERRGLESVSRLKIPGMGGRILNILGRRSLIIYLVHQPILYGLVWSISAVGLAPDRSANVFLRDCTKNCAITFGDEAVCRASCSCTLERLQNQGIWENLVSNPQDPDLRLQLNETYRICLRETPPAPAADD
ncbi:DUF1624 domain-containing protein [Roseibium polysiphoniae]|uniref:DUF1624 domain-containing protein n=1 Tax=Roseibium polysiphoniae TaxID=2571221 RepID=A0ABR9CB72_9HYPH|nr:heparan-alpha-glucosaminide N-acetyltransferase [Roseibium polysiphoniae]MBD8876141.1 DUF1624 domain-containing protein [Roseibium polysiphoniae]